MNQATTPDVAPEVSLTESQGAEALLARWGVGDNAPEQEEPEQPEADEQPQGDAQEQEAEQGEDEPEEAEEAQSEEIEIDVAGRAKRVVRLRDRLQDSLPLGPLHY